MSTSTRRLAIAVVSSLALVVATSAFAQRDSDPWGITAAGESQAAAPDSPSPAEAGASAAAAAWLRLLPITPFA